ncbi:MAG: tetratricopeptide repeat protein [Merismopedia sp. SIO2A8]|nr:tetratricopeptide repeat protein [Merismopedia sp. SIO2A8]
MLSIARKQFAQAVKLSNPTLNLAEAALYLAQEEYPNIEPDEYLNALDTMANEVRERLPSEAYPLRIIQCINQYLFDDLGFFGNQADYYDPENSYFNRVLDRRTGIPITLSLVYLELARRLEFPMVGINMPGHFLIRPDIDDMEVCVDPFNKGDILFPEDCRERLVNLYRQRQAPFTDEEIVLQPDFFAPIAPRRFLARMLRNLKLIYLHQDDLERALAAVDRALLVTPDDLNEQRDRGLIYYKMGDWTDARHDLNHYRDCCPDAEDIDVIDQILDQINRQFP